MIYYVGKDNIFLITCTKKACFFTHERKKARRTSHIYTAGHMPLYKLSQVFG